MQGPALAKKVIKFRPRPFRMSGYFRLGLEALCIRLRLGMQLADLINYLNRKLHTFLLYKSTTGLLTSLLPLSMLFYSLRHVSLQKDSSVSVLYTFHQLFDLAHGQRRRLALTALPAVNG